MATSLLRGKCGHKIGKKISREDINNSVTQNFQLDGINQMSTLRGQVRKQETTEFIPVAKVRLLIADRQGKVLEAYGEEPHYYPE